MRQRLFQIDFYVRQQAYNYNYKPDRYRHIDQFIEAIETKKISKDVKEMISRKEALMPFSEFQLDTKHLLDKNALPKEVVKLNSGRIHGTSINRAMARV